MDNLLNVSPGLIIWTFINFGLFFILIRKFGFKPMLAALDAREKKISESIHQAEQASIEAQKTLKDSREKIANAQSEVMSMLKEGKSQAEMIVKSAAEEAERVKQVKLEEAKREISREKELALQSLRNEVASLVIQATDKVIGKVVSAEQHKGLVESAISELSNN